MPCSSSPSRNPSRRSSRTYHRSFSLLAPPAGADLTHSLKKEKNRKLEEEEMKTHGLKEKKN
jgi:hypothetical protein